jgi:hypothetical protein
LNVFQGAILKEGISISDRVAYWELDPDALEELWYRHNHCDAECCVCPNGRSHTMVGTKWELILCTYCGSKGTHIKCGNLTLSNPKWECGDCGPVLQHAQEESPATVNKIPSKQKQRCLKGSGGLRSKKHHIHSVHDSLSLLEQCTSRSLMMSEITPTTPIVETVGLGYIIIEIPDNVDEDEGPDDNSSKYPQLSVDCSSHPSTSGTARMSMPMHENFQGGHLSQVRCDWYW